jgi:hypothetical protein
MTFRESLTAVILATSASWAIGEPSQLCKQLESQIEGAEMSISANYAEGVGDNSAPRATLRELRTSNEWAEIRVSLSQMQANRCPTLTRVISGTRFMTPALTCATDRLGATTPDSCKRSTWKPAF